MKESEQVAEEEQIKIKLIEVWPQETRNEFWKSNFSPASGQKGRGQGNLSFQF